MNNDISLITIMLILWIFLLGYIHTAEGWYEDFLKGYREAEREQALDNLTPDKDCPATQHVHNNNCMDNADGLAHGRGDNASRSSRLDCASNEFACKASGEMK